MLVKDFMTSIIVTADHDALVSDAARLMAAENVGSLVITMGDVLAGLVTRREMIAAQLLSDDIYHSLTLEEIMITPVVTISPDADLGQTISLMNQTGRTHIPVIEGDDITGMVSSSDIIRVLATVKLLAQGASED
ncbi:MAG: CBS domain-containing protein [Candidatus Thorarchaeota archaeon]|nr:CBS domain-containing protein [Candidatus Thorarchaeota archaeon]